MNRQGRKVFDEVLTGKEIANTGMNTQGMSARDAQNIVKNPFEKLLNTVRDVKDGHMKKFFGYSGAETNNISNKDWLMCFKAHHYRNCENFDLDKAMQGCRYTQLEPNRDTSDYIIPKSYKSPSSSSEKKKFKEQYDSMYTLLKDNPYYSHMFPSNQDGVVKCPTNLTKPNMSKARFPEEEEKFKSINTYEDDRGEGERGEFGPRVFRVPSEWSYWGDQGNPEKILKDLNDGLLNLKANQASINRKIKDAKKMRDTLDTSRRAQEDKAYAISVIDKLNAKLESITNEINYREKNIEAVKHQENKKQQYPKELTGMVEEEREAQRAKLITNVYTIDPEQKYKYPQRTYDTIRDLKREDPSISDSGITSILKSGNEDPKKGGRKKRTKKKRKGRKKVNKKTNKRQKKINRRSKRRRNTRRK